MIKSDLRSFGPIATLIFSRSVKDSLPDCKLKLIYILLFREIFEEDILF